MPGCTTCGCNQKHREPDEWDRSRWLLVAAGRDLSHSLRWGWSKAIFVPLMYLPAVTMILGISWILLTVATPLAYLAYGVITLRVVWRLLGNVALRLCARQVTMLGCCWFFYRGGRRGSKELIEAQMERHLEWIREENLQRHMDLVKVLIGRGVQPLPDGWKFLSELGDTAYG